MLFVVQKDLVECKVIVEINGVVVDLIVMFFKFVVELGWVFFVGMVGDMVGKFGWYMDLLLSIGIDMVEGEWMFVVNQFIGGYLIGVFFIFDMSNVCVFGGRGWVMLFDFFIGINLKDVFFDMNYDGVFDDGDWVKVGNVMVVSGGIGFSLLMGLFLFSGLVMLNNFNGLISIMFINFFVGKGGCVFW